MDTVFLPHDHVCCLYIGIFPVLVTLPSFMTLYVSLPAGRGTIIITTCGRTGAQCLSNRCSSLIVITTHPPPLDSSVLLTLIERHKQTLLGVNTHPHVSRQNTAAADSNVYKISSGSSKNQFSRNAIRVFGALYLVTCCESATRERWWCIRPLGIVEQDGRDNSWRIACVWLSRSSIQVCLWKCMGRDKSKALMRQAEALKAARGSIIIRAHSSGASVRLFMCKHGTPLAFCRIKKNRRSLLRVRF